MFIANGISYAGEPVREIEVLSARVVETLSMLVTFSNNETRLFDASDLLQYPAFERLSDQRVFESFEIDHGTLCWCEGDIDIATEALYKRSYPYETAA